MSDIKIPLDTVRNNFNTFLSIGENSRIFFSGKFGIGKTYFLREFFKQQEADYEVFHIYPVNYQICSNEDILELIKYDILVELLNKNQEIIKKNDYGNFLDMQRLLYLWGKNSFKEILVTGISLIPKLGKPLKDVTGLVGDFYKFKKQIESGNKGIVEKFIKETKEKNPTETDNLSELLKQKIIEQKANKRSVLILDDLDRIDPEHIFRIFNIFSAYFEQEHENKLGFDIVIAVADYSNIKNIFHHKYGTKADFSGYLDKFFTISPYYFDNKKAVIDMADGIAKSLKHEEANLSSAIGEGGYIKLFLREIFIKTLDSGIINLRELLKATRFQLTELNKGGFHQDPFADNFQKIFDIAIRVAIHIFSGIDNFVEKLKVIKNQKMDERRLMPYANFIQPMLKSLGIVDLSKEGEKDIIWRDYQIKKSGPNLKLVKGREDELFYDLLIDYVQSRKYLKSGSGDYRY